LPALRNCLLPHKMGHVSNRSQSAGLSTAASAIALDILPMMKDTIGPPPRRWLANQPYVLLTSAAFFWSTNLIVGRYVADHVQPVALSCVRWGFAAAILLPLAWPHLRRDWPIARKYLPLLTALAATGLFLNSALGFFALHYTTALNALLMQASGPLFVALWALILFRIKMTVSQIFGVLISMAGVAIIILRGDITTLLQVSFNPGDLLMLGGLASFGLYSALLTRKPKMHALSFLTILSVLATALMVPFAILEAKAGFTTKFDALTIFSMLYCGALPSVFSFLCFNRGLELVGPNRAAPFLHLVTVFGSILAIVLLGERLMLFHFVGYPLSLLGVYLAARK
jgi:drug/metabolite transporter (DMT)-like permease